MTATTVNRDQIDTAIELQRDGTHAYRIELAGHTFLLDPDAAIALADELNAIDCFNVTVARPDAHPLFHATEWVRVKLAAKGHEADDDNDDSGAIWMNL